MRLKDDEFFGESDKIKKFQALLKSEFNKRKILTAKNESTALVSYFKNRLTLGLEENLTNMKRA